MNYTGYEKIIFFKTINNVEYAFSINSFVDLPLSDILFSL